MNDPINDNAAAYRPPVDPDGNHYVMSEFAQFDLRMLIEALRSLNALCSLPIDDDGPDFGVEEAAPLFHLCGEFGRRVLSEVDFRARPQD